MKLFKPTYNRDGKKKTCSKWYIGFTDNKQIRRQLPAFTSKAATERAAVKIEELLSACGVLSPGLQKWLEDIPDAMRKHLVSYGLIDNRRLSQNVGKLLVAHLADFCEGLQADGRTAAHVRQTRRHIESILTGCEFQTWTDIDGNRVKTYLAKQRGPDGFGERTYNSHLRSFKQFTAWLLQEDRVAGTDPMKGHSPLRQTEFRKKRRALTLDEMHRLLAVTEAGPVRYRMTGHERALVYRLALQAGLRSGEIASLRVLSFNFDATPPSVRIESADAKAKRGDDMVLMGETAQAIREFLKDKAATDKAFNMPCKSNVADMLRGDLADAEIEYTDAADRDVDFHSLRHSFVSHLALAGVHPAVAQKLARHRTIEMTMKYYTHVLHKSECEAIDSLQSFTSASLSHGQKLTLADLGERTNGNIKLKTALSA